MAIADIVIRDDGVLVTGTFEASGKASMNGGLHVNGLLEASGPLEGNSLLVVNGGYVGGPLTVDGDVAAGDRLLGRGSLVLYSQQSVPLGQYSIPQLSQLMTKCGIDQPKIGLFVTMAVAQREWFDQNIDQSYLLLTDEKISVVSYHPGSYNPMSGTPTASMSVVSLIPQVVSSVDLLYFNDPTLS